MTGIVRASTAMRRSALLVLVLITSCGTEDPQPIESPEADPQASAARKLEALLLEYDKGGRSREDALQALRELGASAIEALEVQVLPKNGSNVRHRAIAILAKLQNYSEESSETKALVMATVGDWDFNERSLQDVCAELQAASGLSFRLRDTVNPRTKVSIKYREGRLNTMLHLMLRPLGLQFIIQGKAVWIY